MKLHFYFLVFILLIFASCRNAYVPNAISNPMHQGKGEIVGSFGFNNMQLSYAATDHIHFFANGQHKATRPDNGDTTWFQFFAQRYLAEGGIGTYANIKNFHLAFQTGFGYGGLDFSQREFGEFQSFKTNFRKYFVIGSIGGVSRFYEGCAFLRLSLLDFNRASIVNTQPGQEINWIQNNFFISQTFSTDGLSSATAFLMEPGVHFKTGTEKLKFQTQFSIPVQLGSPRISYTSVQLLFGVALRL